MPRRELLAARRNDVHVGVPDQRDRALTDRRHDRGQAVHLVGAVGDALPLEPSLQEPHGCLHAVGLGAVVGDQPLCEGEFVGFGHGRDCRLRDIVSTPSLWQEQHPGRALSRARLGSPGRRLRGRRGRDRSILRLAAARARGRRDRGRRQARCLRRQRPQRRPRRDRHGARSRRAGGPPRRGRRPPSTGRDGAVAGRDDRLGGRAGRARRRCAAPASLWVAQDEHERAEIERALSAAAAAGIPCRPAADLIPEPMRDRCGTGRVLPAGRRAAAGDLGARRWRRPPPTAARRCSSDSPVARPRARRATAGSCTPAAGRCTLRR